MIPAGLCETCRHCRVIGNDRGSRFLLCQRSRDDPRYPRYPRLPVIACQGFEPRSDPEKRRGWSARPASATDAAEEVDRP